MLPVAPTTSTVMRVGCSGRRDLVDRTQRVKRARVANERQELGRDVDEPRAIVPDTEIRGDVSLDLRITAAERGEHAEGQELARRDVDSAASTQSPKQLAERKR